VGALAPAAVLLLFAARDRRLRGRCVSSVVAMVVGSGLVTGGWMVLQGHRGDPSWVNPLLGQNTRLAHGFPVHTTLVNLFAEWPPTTNPFLQRGLSEAQMSLWITGTNLLLASGIVAVLLRGRGPALWLSLGTAVGLLSIPVFVQLFSYYGSDHYYFPRVSSRYAICLLPGLVLGLAVTLRGTRARWVAGSLVGVGALVLATSLGGPTFT
jgi:hypothetical protein